MSPRRSSLWVGSRRRLLDRNSRKLFWMFLKELNRCRRRIRLNRCRLVRIIFRIIQDCLYLSWRLIRQRCHLPNNSWVLRCLKSAQHDLLAYLIPDKNRGGAISDLPSGSFKRNHSNLRCRCRCLDGLCVDNLKRKEPQDKEPKKNRKKTSKCDEPKVWTCVRLIGRWH